MQSSMCCRVSLLRRSLINLFDILMLQPFHLHPGSLPVESQALAWQRTSRMNWWRTSACPSLSTKTCRSAAAVMHHMLELSTTGRMVGCRSNQNLFLFFITFQWMQTLNSYYFYKKKFHQSAPSHWSLPCPPCPLSPSPVMWTPPVVVSIAVSMWLPSAPPLPPSWKWTPVTTRWPWVLRSSSSPKICLPMSGARRNKCGCLEWLEWSKIYSPVDSWSFEFIEWCGTVHFTLSFCYCWFLNIKFFWQNH